MVRMNSKPALERAIDLFGSKAELGRRLGVSASLINYWLTTDKVPAEQAIEIERATNGAVTRGELRADVFSEAAQ